MKFYTFGQQRMALSSAGRLSLGLSSSTRLVHIHGTGPILQEMGTQLPPPAGSESLIVITNTESGSTAWDGLRIGLVGSVAQVATLDKIRLDIANNQSTISLNGDGRINFFNLGGGYDAKVGIRSTNENALYIDNSSNQNGYALKIKVTDNSTQAISLVNGNNGKFTVLGDGRMSLGTSSPQPNFMLDVNGAAKIGNTTVVDYSLDVIGKIRACEVRVSDPGWCDFVFDSTYNLLSLENLDQYVQEHHHLPEVPTQKEVEEEGFDLAEMNATLLKKVEELTLYVIELNSEISDLKKQRDANTSEPVGSELSQVDISELNSRLIALEKQLAEISSKTEKK